MLPPRKIANSVVDGDDVGTHSAKKESKERGKVAGWPGYVRAGIFVIEKKIAGRKFHVSTRATTLRGALKQLERFEADPAGYRPGGDRGDSHALVLTEALVEEFFEWHEKSVTRQWALNVRGVLLDWANDLRGADLRRLELVRDVKPLLRGKAQQGNRIKALKALFKWLRTEKGVITRQQDVTLDLAVPATLPAQQTGTEKAVPWEHVVAAAQHLKPETRDVLELLAATGWHLNEVRRFARDGTIRERRASDREDVVAVIGTKHKHGRMHFTNLMHAAHLDIARRIRERGHIIDNGALRKHLLAACKAAKVPAFNMGWMRHSATTWLVEQGVPLEHVSEYLGHRSTTTTRRFYLSAQAAVRVLPKGALRVVGD